MTNKLTINLDKMTWGHNGITKRPYLWAILDEGKKMYEVQVTEITFPSSKKDIRADKNAFNNARKTMKALSHSGQRVSEYYGKNTVQ